MNATLSQTTANASLIRGEGRSTPQRYDAIAKKLRLLVSVALLGWLGWQTDWGRIRDAFTSLKIEWWLAAVGVYFVAQLISALRWQLLARPLGFHESFRQFTGIYFIGMYFNLLLPTAVGGDVVRAWCLDGKSHRRMAAFLSVLVDRLSGLFVLVLVACAGVVLSSIPIPGWIALSVWASAGLFVVAVLTVPILARLFRHAAPLRRLADALRYYWRHPRVLLWTTGISVGVQLANVILVWLVGLALGLGIPLTYYAVFVPLVTLLTLLPISVNGMGIREGSSVLFLAPMGVGEGTALCLAVLWFFALTAVSLCGGMVYFFNWVPRPEVISPYETVDRHSAQGRTGQPAAAA